MTNDDKELFDPRIAEWLEDGPDTAPSLVLRTLGGALPSIPQRRSWRHFWRFSSMTIPKLVGVAAAAVIVVLLGLGAVGLWTGRAPSIGNTGATPSPAPTQAQPSPTAPPTPTPSPSAIATSAPTGAPTAIPTTAVITSADVGRGLQPGAYRVDEFAAPFLITLPAGWNATELTANSVGVSKVADGSVNMFMAVVDKTYSDPCHTDSGPSPVQPGVEPLLAALSAMPGFNVADVTNVTVGGAQGKHFVITNSIDVGAAGCSGEQVLIGTYDKAGTSADISMFGGETDEFWILDAGGTTVLIAVTDNKVATLQPLLDSLTFVGATSN
jgi:hypothetical protein